MNRSTETSTSASLTPVLVKVKVRKPVAGNDDDVLNAIELAAFLRCHPVTVRLDAAAGKIPGRQVGNRWKFSRRAIEAWLAHEDEKAA